MTSPIYSHPRVYEGIMRMLYRQSYNERIQTVAKWIPSSASLADICAGDCSLYRYGCKDPSIDYKGYDIHPPFVRWAQAHGIPFERLDVRQDNIPEADCVVMMSSLYQFIPHEHQVLEKLIQAARQRVILTEPVRNVAQSRVALIRWWGKKLTSVQGQPCDQRFTSERFTELMQQHSFQTLQPIAGGRELLAVLDKPTTSTDRVPHA